MDQISDMLTRIRNAQMANHAIVLIPASRLKIAIAEVLAKENLIDKVDVVDDDVHAGRKNVKITLKYNQISHAQKVPAITALRRTSTPGQRVYVKNDMIRKVRNGYGISVISTSRGVMTGKDAKKKGLGGEVLCEVW